MKRRICCGVRHQKLSSCTASGSKKTGKPLSSSVKKSLACFTKSRFWASISAGEKLAVEKLDKRFEYYDVKPDSDKAVDYAKALRECYEKMTK